MKKSELKELIKECLQEEYSPAAGFRLKIKFGNEASQLENVPDMLREVAKKIEMGKDLGTILDVNGNTVGSFEVWD